jgi:hypothetical protein
MIFSIFLASGALLSQAAAACTRAMLQDATMAYLKAQAAGQLTTLSVLDAKVSYAENDKIMDIKTGVLSQPMTIDFSRSFYDTTECAAVTEVNAASNKHPYVIMTRLLFTGEKITTIESIVTDEGDWAFNATSNLMWNKQEKWDPIPADKRDSRATIKAVGDAYLDNWANPSLPVPHGTPCARLEGGEYTGTRNMTANTCDMGAFPEPIKVGNRRYVIDEELGVMSIFNDFPWLEATTPNKPTQSTNLFRVEGGKTRYIHELTVCVSDHCSRTAPPPETKI